MPKQEETAYRCKRPPGWREASLCSESPDGDTCSSGPRNERRDERIEESVMHRNVRGIDHHERYEKEAGKTHKDLSLGNTGALLTRPAEPNDSPASRQGGSRRCTFSGGRTLPGERHRDVLQAKA